VRFTLPDGKEVVGRGYSDIVQAMAEDKFTRPRSMESYRKATARRCRSMYGTEIPTDSDKEFVNGLIKVGLLQRTA
jgi:hypothetical protein